MKPAKWRATGEPISYCTSRVPAKLTPRLAERLRLPPPPPVRPPPVAAAAGVPATAAGDPAARVLRLPADAILGLLQCLRALVVVVPAIWGGVCGLGVRLSSVRQSGPRIWRAWCR